MVNIAQIQMCFDGIAYPLMVLYVFLMIFDDILGDFIKNHQIPSTSHYNLKNKKVQAAKKMTHFH